MICFPVQDLMAMDTIFATLGLYLLALSCAVVQTGKGNLKITPNITTSDLSSPASLTHKTETAKPFNTTVYANVISHLTPFTSKNQNNKTTLATTESTRPLQTSQSTTIMTPLTKGTPLTATTPSTHTATFTPNTKPAMHTTVGFISTSDTTVITTNSSHTVNTTLHSLDGTTKGKQQVSCFINDLLIHFMFIFNT